MTLASLILELQALAAQTPDGGESLQVRSIYNDRGHCEEAFVIWDCSIADPSYLNGVDPCVVLSSK